MTTPTNHIPDAQGSDHPDLVLDADVLVLGGGPAGTWAAVKAAEAGARVVLADKGYCGASGATAAVGTGVWYVPPIDAERESAMASREALGGRLADRRWMRRVLDETWARVPELDQYGYPFPVDAETGLPVRSGLQGPDYMKRQRQRAARAGVRILDHSPALELLLDDHGAVAGAQGVHRQAGGSYAVRAGATVLATGGCAFLSRTLGCNVDTGEAYLFGVEAGAELSGMEFSNSYSLAPAGTSVTKSAFYHWATFYREDGSVLEGAGSQRGRSVIARTLLTEPVYCRLDRLDEELKALLPSLQPNFFQPFARLGVDPFTQLFPVTLILEGTVRGTGGLRLVDDTCATSVPGLYAAGDAATRQEICGGFTGGGSHNAAWAISSGVWAGSGAADYARSLGQAARTGRTHPAGTAGLRPSGTPGPADEHEEVTRAVQGEVMPYDKNWFRTGPKLEASLTVLDDAWVRARSSLRAEGVGSYRAREAASMLATARWMYRSALARSETRGMHRREDFPELDERQQHRILAGGLDEVWTAEEALGVTRVREQEVAGVIEVISNERCIDCNLCVKVCPTNVFDPVPGDHPVIARQGDCQTCYLCEAYCPVDAMFVAPVIEPLPVGSNLLDERYLVASGLLGRYRRDLGWRSGDEPTAAREVSGRFYHEMHSEPPPSRLPPPGPYQWAAADPTRPDDVPAGVGIS